MKIAINGFGRIGRLAFRKLIKNQNIDVVAINDLSSPEVLAYLLKYDSVHGTLQDEIDFTDNAIIVNGTTITISAERNPADLPWASLEIDVVLECTGIFTSLDKAGLHLEAGAKKVIISAPAGADITTVVYGVNEGTITPDTKIISAASCTTNCLAPMAKALQDEFGIVSGQMTTIHAYTNTQPLFDTAKTVADFRKTRAAADSIIPLSTGAAKAIGLVIPALKGKLDGSAQRVPVHAGSVVELFTVLNKKTTVDEVNAVMKKHADDSYGYNEQAIVSTDIIGSDFGSIFDATLTKIVDAGGVQLVKTVSWYDNEMSFTSQLIRTLDYFGNL